MSTSTGKRITDEQIQAALTEQLKRIQAPHNRHIKSSWQKIAQSLTPAENRRLAR